MLSLIFTLHALKKQMGENESLVVIPAIQSTQFLVCNNCSYFTLMIPIVLILINWPDHLNYIKYLNWNYSLILPLKGYLVVFTVTSTPTILYSPLTSVVAVYFFTNTYILGKYNSFSVSIIYYYYTTCWMIAKEILYIV